MKWKIVFAAASLSVTAVAAPAAYAQFGSLGDVLKQVAKPKLPDLMGGKQPVSTSIKDAVYGDPSHDAWVPPVPARDLASLPRTAEGGFRLADGYFRFDAQSYCLHAGTHGPGGGDGYLYAPLKGAAEDAVESILQNSVAKPQIEQRDIQLLLWAIVSRAKFEDLNPQLKLVASQLLTARQMGSLNRNALSVVTSSQFVNLVGGVPEPLRSIMEAESRMRSMLSGPSLAYDEMESVAVLAGMAPRGAGSVETPATRWSHHPDGYWIRYTPDSYSHTLIEVWVEPDSGVSGKVFDPAVQVAVPGNTSRQRLAQSGRAYADR